MQYKNTTEGSSQPNIPLTPPIGAKSVRNGEWNGMKLEVMPDTGAFRVTINNADGMTIIGIASGSGAVRKNDGENTIFAYAQFGTGGTATGTVLIDDVKVYVCTNLG